MCDSWQGRGGQSHTHLRSLSLNMPQKPNSFIPHGTAERGMVVSGDYPAALWLRLVWVGCVAQPGLSRMPYSARAVHRLLRNGPATTNVVSVPIIRTVPRFSPRLASTRRDCGHYSRAGWGGEKRGRSCRERQPSLRVTWWCSAARSCLSAASSASTFTSIFSCSDSTSSSAFRFTS